MVDSKCIRRSSGSVLLILSWLLFFSHGGDARALRFTFQTSLEIAEVIHRRLQTSSAPYCVALQTANTSALQTALNWACSSTGGNVDCSAIQQGGSCYDPNTVAGHASYAFDSYYVSKQGQSQSCDFGGVAATTSTNPSSGSCSYPSLSGSSTTPGSSNSTTPPTTTSAPPPPSTLGNITSGGGISPTSTDANSSGGNNPVVSLHWIAMLAPFALFW